MSLINDKAVALFEYIKQLCILRRNVVTDVRKQPHVVWIKDFPAASGDVTWIERNSTEDTGSLGNLLFRIHKPELPRCPELPMELQEWIEPGWDNAQLDVICRQTLERSIVVEEEVYFPGEELTTQTITRTDTYIERFEEDEQRTASYFAWLEKREAWRQQIPALTEVRDLFANLYSMYNELRKDPDRYDLMLGNGILEDREHPEIHHPILLSHLNIKLNPFENTLSISDAGQAPELYMMLFSVMSHVNSDLILDDEKTAKDEDIHPLDREHCEALLQSIAHKLSNHSQYVPENSEADDKQARYVIRWDPVIYVCKHLDGSAEMTANIISNIENSGSVPGSLCDILGEEKTRGELQEEEFAVGDACSDTISSNNEEILLPKPANEEQITIAREIQRRNAVLVQGPPGTGKTHTIANLMGNFLAQGKSVLVTSQTNKALSVLKDKVPKEIQDLCVTMLSGGGTDMEKSVDSIVEYISTHSAVEIARQVTQIKTDRNNLGERLREARQRVKAIRYREFSPIVFEGKNYSAMELAQLLAAHAEQLAIIPDPVKPNAAFPLTREEVVSLYASNMQLSAQEETELEMDLPSPEELLSPSSLREGLIMQSSVLEQTKHWGEQLDTPLLWNKESCSFIDYSMRKSFVRAVGAQEAAAFSAWVKSLPEVMLTRWIHMASDGAEAGLRRENWQRLQNAIAETNAYSEEFSAKGAGVEINAQGDLTLAELNVVYQEILEKASSKGRTKILSLLPPKKHRQAVDQVTINQAHPSTQEDVLLVLDWLSLQKKREQLGVLWNDLVVPCGEPQFEHLGKEPEHACYRVGQEIGVWLNWMDEEYPKIAHRLQEAGLQASLCEFFAKPAPGDYEATKRLFDTLKRVLRPAARIVVMVSGMAQFERQQGATLSRLRMVEASAVCKALELALLSADTVAYENAMVQLSALMRKMAAYQKRVQMIERIAHVAPKWADELMHRVGVHGEETPPEYLEDAWSLKQMETLLIDIANTPLSNALAEVTHLTTEYRKKTAKLAATMAWYELLLRIQKHPNMQAALMGWKQTVKKIGKGTGKSAAQLRRRAQELMAQCQTAVPAWIMPIGKVVNSIDPRKTCFDVVIIDEASQSDVTAMVLLYIGKKVIIVGDDEQVSPMAIGTKSEKIQELQNIYLRDKLPNWHLYTPTDSLYDIAARSYRALMLREHFRCVPDIIRYCNYLCYNGKIRPLREAGNSPVLPSIVSYNAQGERNGKTNLIEAETIVSLIMACMEQPEYDGQTFGVISMLGDDQVKLVDRLLYEKIDLPQREERQILCGNASNFQGDERDVVFLSLVDSNASDGPLNLFSDRKENKQRYNVAVSRAKNQLLIVHSLDYTRDLKAGDLRRGLLEYADDPRALEKRMEEAAEHAESPFETEVAQALIARGYHIEQQHQVGSYRIDMIAICDNKRVAIECDGERWHSTPEQIAQDMSRQEILERLGWTFIRIRGSEYYLHREKAIERVVQQLKEYSIMPESVEQPQTSFLKDSMLLKTVKSRAQQIRNEWHEEDLSGDISIPKSTGSSSVEKTMEVHETPSIIHSEKKAKASQASNKVNASVPELSAAAKPDEAERKKSRETEHLHLPLCQAQKAKWVEVPSADVEFAAKEAKQISIDDMLQDSTAGLPLYEELAQNGFTLIDNRKTSGIVWVLYDKTKKQLYNQIVQTHCLQPCLEMRGSLATANKPAWRIMEKKEGK